MKQYICEIKDIARANNALRNKLPAMEEQKAALVAFHQDNIKKVNALYNANKRVELCQWANEALT